MVYCMDYAPGDASGTEGVIAWVRTAAVRREDPGLLGDASGDCGRDCREDPGLLTTGREVSEDPSGLREGEVSTEGRRGRGGAAAASFWAWSSLRATPVRKAVCGCSHNVTPAAAWWKYSAPVGLSQRTWFGVRVTAKGLASGLGSVRVRIRPSGLRDAPSRAASGASGRNRRAT